LVKEKAVCTALSVGIFAFMFIRWKAKLATHFMKTKTPRCRRAHFAFIEVWNGQISNEMLVDLRKITKLSEDVRAFPKIHTTQTVSTGIN
jgi:hypothetical protein